MGNAYLNMNRTHNNRLFLDAVLRRNWHIDKKSLKYRAALVHV
jgi:hypothetical protein